jgi:hypothetical protein
MKKYLVAYTFQNYGGAGNGRTFGTAPSVTEETIVSWEKMIREQNGFSSVGVYNVVPLEDKVS